MQRTRYETCSKMEPYELEVTLALDVAKGVMRERHVDLIVIDANCCLQEEFDLIDYQLDHGLEIPMVLVGGESTGIRRRIRSKKGIRGWIRATPTVSVCSTMSESA